MTNVSEPTLFRLRVAYPKLGRIKYLGHLELEESAGNLLPACYLS